MDKEIINRIINGIKRFNKEEYAITIYIMLAIFTPSLLAIFLGTAYFLLLYIVELLIIFYIMGAEYE